MGAQLFFSALGNKVFLQLAHEGLLLGTGLETTVAELGAGVDKLQVDLLESESLGLREQALAERDWTLF